MRAQVIVLWRWAYCQPTIRRIFFRGEKETGEGPPDRRLAYQGGGVCTRIKVR